MNDATTTKTAELARCEAFLKTAKAKKDAWVRGLVEATVARLQRELAEDETTLKSRLTGEMKAVRYGDPVWCLLDNARVRFVRFVDSTSVEVMDNDGRRVLPDYRHPSQLLAY